MKKNTILNMVCIGIVLTIFSQLSAFASAQNLVNFTLKSEKAIIGKYNNLNFSSTINDDDSVSVLIKLNNKHQPTHQ